MMNHESWIYWTKPNDTDNTNGHEWITVWWHSDRKKHGAKPTSLLLRGNENNNNNATERISSLCRSLCCCFIHTDTTTQNNTCHTHLSSWLNLNEHQHLPFSSSCKQKTKNETTSERTERQTATTCFSLSWLQALGLKTMFHDDVFFVQSWRVYAKICALEGEKPNLHVDERICVFFLHFLLLPLLYLSLVSHLFSDPDGRGDLDPIQVGIFVIALAINLMLRWNHNKNNKTWKKQTTTTNPIKQQQPPLEDANIDSYFVMTHSILICVSHSQSFNRYLSFSHNEYNKNKTDKKSFYTIKLKDKTWTYTCMETTQTTSCAGSNASILPK